jgi:hypothetical protein
MGSIPEALCGELTDHLNGTNNKNNLILLTAKEHYLAHWLLWRIHENSSMAYAFHLLSISKLYEYKNIISTLEKTLKKNYKVFILNGTTEQKQEILLLILIPERHCFHLYRK